MEKKGELLNQLAIISDLIERANMEATEMQVIYTVPKSEFDRIFEIINQKTKDKKSPVIDKFSIRIGDVDIVFNTSNV